MIFLLIAPRTRGCEAGVPAGIRVQPGAVGDPPGLGISNDRQNGYLKGCRLQAKKYQMT
jgi:hypothetical protein